LNHCSRVSFYATLLANRLNLTVSEQKSLALGSFLHDIGHVADPEYEFGASDEPGAEAVELVRAHPDLGARMILPLGFPAEVGQIVAYHHERFDGSGYPHGLQGEGIPLLARIVSIAQAFDHLTADIPDRQGVGIDAAIQRIALMAETQFDPMLTDIFTRVVSECKASLPALAIAAMPSSSSPEA
jgi:putative nucleotidyltransferase with HDIG domain